MNRHTRRSGLSWLLWSLWSLPTLLPAQDAATAVAEALVAKLAPERDDADAILQRLIRVACTHAESPLAAIAFAEAIDSVTAAPDPAAARELLHRLRPARLHGLADVLCRRLEYDIAFTLSGRTAAHGPADHDICRDFATALAVVGPFGDAGDHHVGVVYAPELRFPEPGERLAGRFGPVLSRIVRRPRHESRVSLPERSRALTGVWYAWHRVHTAEPLAGFVEIDIDGAWQAFLDGHELERVEPWLQNGPTRRRLGIRLVPGEHHLLVKTCSNDGSRVGIRWIDADGRALPLRELAADSPRTPPPTDDPRDPAQFVDGLTVLEQALARSTGATRDLLRVVVAHLARRERQADRALELLLAAEQDPPAAPELQLAIAGMLRATAAIPEERRAAAARRIEDSALPNLPANHHRARLTRVRQLEEQDRREDALRLLREAIGKGDAGPETFWMLYGVNRALEFTTEEPALLADWAAACPRDSRPRRMLAERARSLGAATAALQGMHAVALLRTDSDNAVSTTFWLALDLGQFDIARAMIDRLTAPPAAGEVESLHRLQWRSFLHWRADETEAATAALRALADHPDADAELLRRTGERCLAQDQPELARDCWRRALHLQPDHVATKELLRGIGEPPAPEVCARFRRDGDAAIAAFKAGEREQTASTTALIDQTIIELHADGSHATEVHQLRRINDQAGVEQHTNAADPANADDLLLVRTITADGRSWVPVEVDRSFAMPRVEPGAFVEWRYREHSEAPGADPLRVTEFHLQSGSEPYVLSELVLIRPTDCRGELRTRRTGPPDETIALDDGRQALIWRREQQPRLPDEPFAPAAEDLVPIVGFGEDGSWLPAARGGRVQLLQRTHPTPPIRSKAGQLFADCTDDTTRLQRAWQWCQQQIEPGSADNATEGLLRGKGSAFLVTVALLRAADVPLTTAFAVHARADLDAAGPPLFGDSDRFPLPAVRIEPRGGTPTWLFVDSPRWFPPGAVAAQRSGAPALLAHADRIELIRLPTAAAPAPFTSRVTATGTVGERAVRVEAEVLLFDAMGYAFAENLRQRKADVRKQFARQICQQLFAEWRVRAGEPKELDPGGKPLLLAATVERAGPQRRGDDGWLLPLPLPPGKFLANFGDRAERTLPLVLTMPMQADWVFELDPTDNLEFGDLPAPLLVQHGPLDYQLTLTRLGRRIRIERRVRLAPATLAVTAFGEWVRILETIDRAEQQSLTLLQRTR
ncbi:MAG: hypothetical protein IPK26_24945 [Planctomycetes bacterium]|nr:hypothetical protein [Planctomycetota bacterium]